MVPSHQFMMVMNQNVYLNVIAGLGSKIKSQVNFDSQFNDGTSIAKIIKLPSSRQTVAQFTRDLTEIYIPREWLLQIFMCLNKEKEKLMISYGCSCYTTFQLKGKTDPSEPMKTEKEGSCMLSVKLMVGENVMDAVTLSSEDCICDHVEKWKLMVPSSSCGIISERLYLWLDIQVKNVCFIGTQMQDKTIDENHRITLFHNFDVSTKNGQLSQTHSNSLVKKKAKTHKNSLVEKENKFKIMAQNEVGVHRLKSWKKTKESAHVQKATEVTKEEEVEDKKLNKPHTIQGGEDENEGQGKRLDNENVELMTDVCKLNTGKKTITKVGTRNKGGEKKRKNHTKHGGEDENGKRFDDENTEIMTRKGDNIQRPRSGKKPNKIVHIKKATTGATEDKDPKKKHKRHTIQGGKDENEEQSKSFDNKNTQEHFPKKISCEELQKKVHELFHQLPDKKKITMRQFGIMIETSLEANISKVQKKMMKEQLITLLNSKTGHQSDQFVSPTHSINNTSVEQKKFVRRKRDNPPSRTPDDRQFKKPCITQHSSSQGIMEPRQEIFKLQESHIDKEGKSHVKQWNENKPSGRQANKADLQIHVFVRRKRNNPPLCKNGTFSERQ